MTGSRGLDPDVPTAAMRSALRLTLSSPHSFQEALLADRGPRHDSLTWQTRGRFTGDEVAGLLRSVSPIAHPHGATDGIVAAVTFLPAGVNHGWPSYRAAATAPTDGDVALGISWRLTVPHRDTVISEVDNVWAHPVDDPLTLPEPRPEREPITEGMVGVILPSGGSVPMYDGVVPARHLEDSLAPRVYTEGGPALLSDAESDYLVQVVRALVHGDRDVLEDIGAYAHGNDPYRWTRDYGHRGEVHFIMPPGDIGDWPVDVMQVDDRPGVSFLVVDLWTAEEGRSDLSLELNLSTDKDGGAVHGEFVNLHVM